MVMAVSSMNTVNQSGNDTPVDALAGRQVAILQRRGEVQFESTAHIKCAASVPFSVRPEPRRPG